MFFKDASKKIAEVVFPLLVSLLPAVGHATICYDTKWAILSGSVTEINGKTPGEVCNQAKDIEALNYPVRTILELKPISWATDFSSAAISYKDEPIRYECTVKLEKPSQNLTKISTYFISHYYKPSWSTANAWAFGGVRKKDDCQTCNICTAQLSGSTEVGGRGFHADRAGFPITYVGLTKTKSVQDWQSSRDLRFRFDRLYSSSEEGIRSYSQMSMGESWWTPFERTVYQQGNSHFLYLEEGIRREFFGSATFATSTRVYSAQMNDHPFRMERDASTPMQTSILYVSDGSGRKETYTEWINFNVSSGVQRILKLAKITWADGYEISISRDANRRISAIQDNKGQRAEVFFTVIQGTVPEVVVIDRILIDTNYSGAIFAADVEIDYQYQSVAEQKDVALLASAQTIDLASSSIIKQQTYRYIAVPGDASPAKLVAFQDGRLTDSGSPFDAEIYAYAIGGNGKAVASSTSLAGGVSNFTATMDANGDTVFTNPLGKTTRFDVELVDSRYRVVSVTGAPTQSSLASNVTTSFIAPSGMPKGWVYSTTARNGSRTDYTRDARGLVLTKTENANGASPRVTSYTWHATLRLPLTRSTNGLLETFSYSPEGLLLTYRQTDTKVGSPTNGQNRTTTYTYTNLASGLKVLTGIDGPGLTSSGISDTTTFSYTAAGELISATDAVGLVTTVIARNDQGQATEIEEPNLNRWFFTYDRLGRVKTAGMAGPGQSPQLTSFTYDIVGQLVSMTDTRGKTWSFRYDLARRLVQAVAPTGDVANFTYDSIGNLTRTEYRGATSAIQFWQATEFDELSRVLKTIGAMGQQWTYSYDVEDNPVGEVDPLNHPISKGFDAFNRLASVVDRETFATSFAYDPKDQLTTFTDPRTIATSFAYNGFGEIITETSADRGVIAYTYDQRGLVKMRTDARGVTVGYSYDNAGRLTLIDYPAGAIPDVTFTYDTAFLGVPANSNKGMVGRITDGVIDTRFGHEVLASGPRVKATSDYPGGRSYTVVEEADFEGNPSRFVYPSGREVLIDVDDVNRVSRIRLRDGATTTTLMGQITYAPMGPMVSALYGDGYTQTRTYDLSYRLTGITDAQGATKLRDVAMGYEGRDNLSSVTDLMLPANSETFTYTPRESLSGATGPYGTLSYTYDGVGNRLTASTDAALDTYAYPASSNRLSTINLALGGTRGFTYDAAGNVISEARSGGAYAYTYNAAGRMETFSINGILQASYKYDAMGRQAIRTLTSLTPVTIHSVFDSQGRRIAEYVEATGALIREYVWNGWEPIAVIEGGVVSSVRADHIGRPVFATNASGVKVWSATYLPFGGVHVSTGNLPTNRFPGQWFQSESGLHQNWMRDYDPTSGRYLQADPLGLVDGASVYGYVKGNSVNGIDPLGLFDPTGYPDYVGVPADPFDGLLGGGGGGGGGFVTAAQASSAAQLAAAVASAHGGEVLAQGVGLDGGQTADPAVEQPRKRGGQYVCNCLARCNDNIPENCPDPNGNSFAHGSEIGPNLFLVRKAARKNAEAKLMCQGKHTTCKCTGPKGDRIND